MEKLKRKEIEENNLLQCKDGPMFKKKGERGRNQLEDKVTLYVRQERLARLREPSGLSGVLERRSLWTKNF